jgi:hypothetical protein
MAKLSIVIPSRDERFLIPTIDDIFAHATGEIEVVAVLDSNIWPEGWKEVTERHPNLHTIHNGGSIGMRASINKGVGSAISRGATYIAKSDGHCSFSPGFDEVLKAEMDDNWVVVPRRLRLDPEAWTIAEPDKPPYDYHYLSFPDDPNDFGGPGLNGKPWVERQKARADILIDDEMSSQGSFWAMKASYFERLELMDQHSYGPFWNEFQELGLKCWLSGGKVMVNKRCHYLHLHKGKKYGRGYRLEESALTTGRNHTIKWIWNEAWDKQTLPFEWLIDHFWPVPSWPENWEERLYATRKPRVIGVEVAGMGSDRNDDGSSTGSLARTDLSLRIHSAWYGIGPPPDSVDVGERVQSLVKDNSLDIIVNNSTLTPEQNPFRGKKKTLAVHYSYDSGPIQVVERDEKDWLIIGQAQRRVPRMPESEAAWAKVEKVVEEVESLARKTYQQVVLEDKPTLYAPDGVNTLIPTTPTALNDYLIRKFSISPQRLRAPMPIELSSFHRNDLAQLFAELGFKRGAEIGVAEGKFSQVLLEANPRWEHLLLIDPWHAYSGNPQNKSKEKHEFALNETRRKTAGYSCVRMVQDYSMRAVQGVDPESLDMVYIDASHLFDDCVMDIIEWAKRVRSGGIVSGDDYYQLDQKRWVGGGVVEAVQAYVNAHRIPIWWLLQGYKSVDFMWVKP